MRYFLFYSRRSLDLTCIVSGINKLNIFIGVCRRWRWAVEQKRRKKKLWNFLSRKKVLRLLQIKFLLFFVCGPFFLRLSLVHIALFGIAYGKHVLDDIHSFSFYIDLIINTTTTKVDVNSSLFYFYWMRTLFNFRIKIRIFLSGLTNFLVHSTIFDNFHFAKFIAAACCIPTSGALWFETSELDWKRR